MPIYIAKDYADVFSRVRDAILRKFIEKIIFSLPAHIYDPHDTLQAYHILDYLSSGPTGDFNEATTRRNVLAFLMLTDERYYTLPCADCSPAENPLYSMYNCMVISGMSDAVMLEGEYEGQSYKISTGDFRNNVIHGRSLDCINYRFLHICHSDMVSISDLIRRLYTAHLVNLPVTIHGPGRNRDNLFSFVLNIEENPYVFSSTPNICPHVRTPHPFDDIDQVAEDIDERERVRRIDQALTEANIRERIRRDRDMTEQEMQEWERQERDRQRVSGPPTEPVLNPLYPFFSAGVEIELAKTKTLSKEEFIDSLVSSGLVVDLHDEYHSDNRSDTLWSLEYDSSVSGYGLELISPIFYSMSDMVTNVCKVFSLLASLGCKPDSSAGLHVHFGTQMLVKGGSPEDYDNIPVFLRSMLVGKDKEWNSILPYHRTNNNYAYLGYDAERKLDREDYRNRYLGIAYRGDTIEFRLAPSCFVLSKVLRWIMWCHEVVVAFDAKKVNWGDINGLFL